MNIPNTQWPLLRDPQPVEEDPTYPKISIVTPSYNQGEYLEETILSVLNQNYPNLEYFIFDGGSTDNSVEVIKKYERFITYWESKPDKGQTDAINKGLKRCTGEIIAYINSDDYYQPQTFSRVAEEFKNGNDWICGSTTFLHMADNSTMDWMPREDLLTQNHLNWVAKESKASLPQPSVFWSRKFHEAHGYFREDMHYSFDTEFWIRLLSKNEKITFINQNFSVVRFHEDAKTSQSPEKFLREFDEFVVQPYTQNLSDSDKRLFLSAKKEYKTTRLVEKFLGKVSQEKKYLPALSYLGKAFFRDPVVTVQYFRTYFQR